MEFEVYCDESGIEAVFNKEAHTYFALSSIWLPNVYREQLKNDISCLKEKYKINSELKWSKVSPATLSLYKEVITLLFANSNYRFRVIIVESSQVNHFRFNNSDSELGYYKFYYQLLHHWISDFNKYEIFIDLKTNRVPTRLKNLKDVLSNANLTSSITQIQGLPSHQSIGIQVADLIGGLTLAKFNKQITSTAKIELIKHVESIIKKPIKGTYVSEDKYNVFRINLQGGW